MKLQARFSLDGRAEAVRETIALVMQSPPLSDLSPEDRAAVELVLAEVLNNIVEHAYGGYGGRMEVELRREERALFCQITDHGPPLHSGDLPAGKPPPPEELAEGGYGWFLIRSLANDLSYRREGGRNSLSFRLLPAAVLPLRTG